MSEPQSTPVQPAPRQYLTLTAAELGARKRRNVWIALGLVAFMVLLFTTTFLRMMHNQAQARLAQGQVPASAPVGSVDR